jgi:F0F1-type ATP synthase assembly protein I
MTEPLRGSAPDVSLPTSSATPRARRRKRPAREMVTSDHNDGWTMAVELVTATLTWGGIGYLIDRFWLHTEPVFMSIGFVVGFFAGMYLLYLRTSREVPTDTKPEQGSGDDRRA